MQTELIRTFLDRLTQQVWHLSVEKIANKPFVELTFEDIKTLARDFWQIFSKQFWIRWAEWMAWWDLHGGYHWLLIPVALIVIHLFRRRYQTPNVDKLETKGDVKGLIKALNYKIDETATEMGEEEMHVDSQAVKVRCAAANALGDFREPLALQGLLRGLSDPDKYVRINVVRSLGNLGGDTVERALKLVAEKDPDEFVRYVAEDFLEGKGW